MTDEIKEAALGKVFKFLKGGSKSAAKGGTKTTHGTAEFVGPSGQKYHQPYTSETPSSTPKAPKAAPKATTPSGPGPGTAGAIVGGGILGAATGSKLAQKLKGDSTPAPAAEPTTPDKATELPKIDVPGEKKEGPKTFGQAFAAARKAATEKGAKSTGQFEWEGKKYQTNIQGTGTTKKPQEKYVPTAKQTKVGTDSSQPTTPKAETPVASATADVPRQMPGATEPKQTAVDNGALSYTRPQFPMSKKMRFEAAMAMPPSITPPAIVRPAAKQAPQRLNVSASGTGSARFGATQSASVSPPKAPARSTSLVPSSGSRSPTTTGGTSAGASETSGQAARSLVPQTGSKTPVPSSSPEPKTITTTYTRLGDKPIKAPSKLAAVGKAAALVGAGAALGKAAAARYKEQHGSTHPTTPGVSTAASFERMKGMKAPDAPKTTVDAPTPPSRPDYFTRGQAFSAARKEAGGKGGKFSYGGKEYHTGLKGEKPVAISKLKTTSVKEENDMTDETINELSSFGRKFSQEMKRQGEGKTFKWHGKDILLKYADNKPKSDAPKKDVPLPPRRPTEHGGISPAPKPMSSISPSPAKSYVKSQSDGVSRPTDAPGVKRAEPAPSDTQGKKTNLGTNKMSEDINPLISAFLSLQNDKSGNMFEAAKHLSDKQKKLAAVAGDKEKIDAEDLAALRAGKKMHEASIYDKKNPFDPNDPSVQRGSSEITSEPAKKTVSTTLNKTKIAPLPPAKSKEDFSPVTKDNKPYISPESKKAGMGVKEETEVNEAGMATVAQVGRNFLANVAKGYRGSPGNVTRNIDTVVTKSGATRPTGSTFAAPGGASKAGESIGATARAVKEKPIAAAIGGGAAAASAGLGMKKPSVPASGRSVADYEKEVVTPKPAEKKMVDAPQPPSRPTYMSRGQAFSAARKEAGGAGGKFTYGGKEYSTQLKGEKAAKKLTPTSVKEDEEFGFSEAELAHIAAILEAEPVAPTDSDETTTTNTSTKVARRNLTDSKKWK